MPPPWQLPKPRLAPTTRCSSGENPALERPTCCMQRAIMRNDFSPVCESNTSPPKNSPTTSSTPCVTIAKSRSNAATAMSTSYWSTTFSSSKAKKVSRKSSSTRLTHCTTPINKLSSHRTGHPNNLPPSRIGYEPVSNGVSSPTYSHLSWKPGSRFYARKPKWNVLPYPTTSWSSLPAASNATSANSKAH